MKEIVIVSGKGGTGKTSLTAAFVGLAGNAVIADCDVDAANLHLLLAPEIKESHEFFGGQSAEIDPEVCTGCGLCESECRFQAILPPAHPEDGIAYRVDSIACEGCGVCAYVCPENAIRMEPELSGHWFRSQTRFGWMVHAELLPARENSGKLVSVVRREARATAEEIGAPFILVDGPPGIGCPVIASLTGADYAVMVAEPTVSGIEDLGRITELAAHFHIRAGVVINKADLNPAAALKIRDFAARSRLDLLGEIPYDIAVTHAQVEAKTLLEAESPALAETVRRIWQRVRSRLEVQDTSTTPFAVIS